MPTNLHHATTGSGPLLFPSDDDYQTVVWELDDVTLWTAEEVSEEIDHDGDLYGRFLPVAVDGEARWLQAPGELVDELQEADAQPGDTYQVTRAEKSGDDSTSPWEVNITEVG